MIRLRDYNVPCVVIALALTWISVANAGIASKYPKFDFPSHIVGANHSTMNDLKDYLKYDHVDLGVDNFNDDAPMHLRQALASATLSKYPALNQYSAETRGHPRLLEAIARFYSKIIRRPLEPMKNILITVGATEAVYCAFQGHTRPGDEWIVIEPAYTMYLPMIKMARGVPRFTTLKLVKKNGTVTGEDWKLNRREMESLFNNRTKGILLNNPLNPIGKVYTRNELMFIAKMAVKYNTMVISDEAHEWITHTPHIRIATLPGMWERTITIGSASKSFSVSGWRVGWAYGPEDLLSNLEAVTIRAVDSPPTPQQEALAYGFEEELRNFGKPYSFFSTKVKHVKEKQDFMVKAFNKAGLTPVIPGGGFCLLAATLKNATSIEGTETDAADMRFVKWLIKNVGVLGLPLSSFYSEGHRNLGETHVRYCFHKNNATLKAAVKNLQKLKAVRQF